MSPTNTSPDKEIYAIFRIKALKHPNIDQILARCLDKSFLKGDIGQWFILGSRCNLNRFQVEPKSAGRVMSAVLTSPPTAQHP